MICANNAVGEVCFTNGSGVSRTLMVHYVYGMGTSGNAILESTVYTEADGTPVDTSGGTVNPGACPIASPDVEWERLCDVQSDGTFVEFLCRVVTSFDTAGAPIDPVQTDYFELDKVTAYTPTGTVGPCPDCPPAAARGVLTSWG